MSIQLPLVLQLIVTSLNVEVVARYCTAAGYIVCFYDWIISLDQEVSLMYPSPWNSVKVTYIFCRYYPLAIAPFHLWGLLGDHEQWVCEKYYRTLYACTMPTIFSAELILMLRSYAFSGRKTMVLAVLSITFLSLVGVNIWVASKEITMTPMFLVAKRSACVAVSDQSVRLVLAASATQGNTELVLPPTLYHLGLISILSASFDGLNMLILIWQWIRERGTLGPLGQSFLTQGLLVYVAMTALNTLSIGTFFSSSIYPELEGVGPGFACVLPSPLSCRLVLMLRRKASPTESELRDEYSHMINEALEMIPVECYPEDLSKGTTSTISGNAQGYP